MRPSAFSEQERHRYQAEKMMLRQFLLMKQQSQVPDSLSVRNMKTWLLRKRSFLKEFEEIIKETGIDHLFMAELTWATERRFCVNQMEQELLKELDKEKQLSQLFSRKVTLEGLQMFISAIHPGAEEDVQTLVASLQSKLLRFFGGQTASVLLSAQDAKPDMLKLEQSAMPLIPEVVDIVLKFLLEEPELRDKNEATSAEIGKLLSNSTVLYMPQFREISKTILLGLCTTAAKSIVKAIYKRIDQHSKAFQQMDYDDSFFSARKSVISAIQEMNHGVQTATTSQVCLKLRTTERPEKKDTFPPVCLEDMPTMTSPTEDIVTSVSVISDDQLAELQQEEVKETKGEEFPVEDLVNQNMDNEVKPAVATKSYGELSISATGLMEEREAPPQATATNELEYQLLEKREASVEKDTTDKLKEELLEESGPLPATDVSVYLIDELKLGQEEVVEEVEETQESIVQDRVRKDKRGVRSFFRRLWKLMTCCCCVPTNTESRTCGGEGGSSTSHC